MSLKTTESLKTSAESSSVMENTADINVNSTFNSEYTFVPFTISNLENSVSLIEVIGNTVVLKLTKESNNIDIIKGSYVFEILSPTGTDTVPISSNAASLENVIVEWINTKEDKTGISIDSTDLYWDSGSPYTADAVIKWRSSVDFSDYSSLWFKVINMYSRRSRGSVIWINSSSDRSGIEYQGALYIGSGYTKDSYIKWTNPKNEFIIPETGDIYYIKIVFDIGIKDVDLNIEGEVSRTSYLSGKTDNLTTFQLEGSPVHNANRTLLIKRESGTQDNTINALTQLKLNKSLDKTGDVISIEDYGFETFLDEPILTRANERSTEFLSQINSPDYKSGAYDWLNGSEDSASHIIWREETRKPLNGQIYYLTIQQNDYIEKLSNVTINWINQFADQTGIDYNSELTWTTELSEAWINPPNDTVPAKIQWDNSAPNSQIINNSDIITITNNWKYISNNGYINELTNRVFVNSSGGSIYDSTTTITNISTNEYITFFFQASETWVKETNPALELFLEDGTTTSDGVAFSYDSDDEWKQIIIDISDFSGLDLTDITKIGFQNGGTPISNLSFKFDKIEFRHNHPSLNDYYYLNISYFDPSIPLNKTNLISVSGFNDEKTELVGNNLDLSNVPSLAANEYYINKTGLITIGTAINPLTIGDKLVLNYFVDSGVENNISVTIDANARTGSHYHFESNFRGELLFFESYDGTNTLFREPDISGEKYFHNLFQLTSPHLDYVYVGGEKKFKNIYFDILQTATWSVDPSSFIIEYYDGSTWISTGLTYIDNTIFFTIAGEKNIELIFSSQDFFESWETTTLTGTSVERDLYWIRISVPSEGKTLSQLPQSYQPETTSGEYYIDRSFKKINNVSFGNSNNRGSLYDKLKIISFSSNFLKLDYPLSKQLDLIDNQANTFGFRRLTESTGKTLDLWGIDLNSARTSEESDDEYRNKLLAERQFLPASSDSILNYVARLLDVEKTNLILTQWWDSSWTLDLITTLYSSTIFGVAKISASGTIIDAIPIDLNYDNDLLLSNPYFYDIETLKPTTKLLWANTNSDNMGYKLDDFSNDSERPFSDWSGTKSIIWKNPPLDTVNAVVEPDFTDYYVGFYAYDIETLSLSDEYIIDQNTDFLSILQNIPGDQLTITDNVPPFPGWAIEVPLLLDSSSDVADPFNDFLAHISSVSIDSRNYGLSASFKNEILTITIASTALGYNQDAAFIEGDNFTIFFDTLILYDSAVNITFVYESETEYDQSLRFETDDRTNLTLNNLVLNESNTFVYDKDVLDNTSTEKVKNGGFELNNSDPVAFWNYTGSAGDRDPFQHTGSYSFVWNFPSTFTLAIDQDIDVLVDYITEISLWTWIQQTVPTIRILLTYSDFTTVQQDFNQDSGSLGSWEKHTFTLGSLTAGKNITNILITTSSTIIIYMDDITIQYSPPVNTGISSLTFRLQKSAYLSGGRTDIITMKSLKIENLIDVTSDVLNPIPVTFDKTRFIAMELYGRRIKSLNSVIDQFARGIFTNDWAKEKGVMDHVSAGQIDTSEPVHGIGLAPWINYAGQTFEGDGGDVESIGCYIAAIGSPTGNIGCYIYASTGSGHTREPTGAILATATEISASVTETDYKLITFEFPTPYTTTDSVFYFWVIYRTVGDGSNYIRVYGNSDVNIHEGNAVVWIEVVADWTTQSKHLSFFIFNGDQIFIDLAEDPDIKVISDYSLRITDNNLGESGSIISNGEIPLSFDASTYEYIQFQINSEKSGNVGTMVIVYDDGGDLRINYDIEVGEINTWETKRFPLNVPLTTSDNVKQIGFGTKDFTGGVTFYIDDIQFINEETITLSVYKALSDTEPDYDEVLLTRSFKTSNISFVEQQFIELFLRSTNVGNPMQPIIFETNTRYFVVLQVSGTGLEIRKATNDSNSEIFRKIYSMHRNKKELEGGIIDINDGNGFKNYHAPLSNRKAASTYAEINYTI